MELSLELLLGLEFPSRLFGCESFQQPTRLSDAVSPMPEFKEVIAKLKKHYGSPAVPPAKGPFKLVIWENACYLLPDDRRAAVFQGLREQVGLNAKAILKVDDDVLLALATMGACVPRCVSFAGRRLPELP